MNAEYKPPGRADCDGTLIEIGHWVRQAGTGATGVVTMWLDGGCRVRFDEDGSMGTLDPCLLKVIGPITAEKVIADLRAIVAHLKIAQ